jgi:2-dehydro-3-deoxyphosphogalactonate aldolase
MIGTFTAIASPATALNLFPAEALAPAVLKAHRAILPSRLPVLPLGAIRSERTGAGGAGPDGFGRGPALHQSAGASADAGAQALKFMVEIGSTCGRAMAKGDGR